MPETGTTVTHSDTTCLHCGYDLRMLDRERCPECGQPIDRGPDRVSRIPWVHRVNQGRIRSYLKTVWLVTVSQRRLNDELNRPADVRSAKRFWLISATLTALPWMGLYILFWSEMGGLRFNPPPSVAPYMPPEEDVPWARAAYFDLQMPWMLGVYFSPLILVLIWAVVVTNAGIATCLLDAKQRSAAERTRAISLAYYASGSLIVLALLSVGGVATGVLMRFLDATFSSAARAALIIAATGGLAGVLYLWRLIRLRIAMGSCGFFRGICFAMALPVLWAINIIFWLGGVPWFAGMLWVFGRSW